MDEGGVQHPCRDRNGLLPRSFAMITAGRISCLAFPSDQEAPDTPKGPCIPVAFATKRRNPVGKQRAMHCRIARLQPINPDPLVYIR